MFESMIYKITPDTAESSSSTSTTCRRVGVPRKSEARKAGNLRRKRMELRKMRMIAKEMWDEAMSSNSDEQQSNDEDHADDSNNKKRARCSDTDSSGNEEVEAGSDDDHHHAKRRKYGRISVIGRRREMEDAVAVELEFAKNGEKSYDFYGVYDGHGGWRVAEACSEMMHDVLVKVLGEEEVEEEEGVCWEKVMVEGFKKMDEEVNKKGAMVAMTGSTAVVAVVGEDEVVIANCGDSRAVMRRGGAAVALSNDHKPDRPDELERIEDSGGKVIDWNGQRVLGVLATSRSIGDYYLKPYVITEPEVKVIKRTDSDEFLILASDGLWDVISNDLACQVARRCLDGQIRRRDRDHDGSEDPCGGGIDACSNASEAAAILAELAIARGSRDNISIVVVELKRNSAGGNGR